MLKFILLAALVSVAAAGHLGGLYGGYGYAAGGYGGHSYGHGGHGGFATVQVHQTPHSSGYGLQEHGHGYNKYVHQSASTAHAVPVVAYGHGGYGGYGHGGLY